MKGAAGVLLRPYINTPPLVEPAPAARGSPSCPSPVRRPRRRKAGAETHRREEAAWEGLAPGMEEPAAGGGGRGGGGGGFVDIEVDLPGCERPVAVRRRDLEWGEDFVDPSFFDPGYSVAASTGHVMWEGSWALIRLLQAPPDDVPGGRLNHLVRGRRVVELGAGTGLLGLCMAARGAHVLLTDVRPVVEDTLQGNIARNGGGAGAGGGAVLGGGR